MTALNETIPRPAPAIPTVGPRPRSMGQRSAHGTAWPARFEGVTADLLGALRGESVRLTQTLAEARRKLTELRSTRQVAERADLQAAADAMRRGEPTPKPKAVLAHEEAVRATELEAEAATLALRDLRRDVDAIVAEHRGAFLAEMVPKADAAQARFDDILEQLRGALVDLADWRLSVRWARDYPGTRSRPAPPSIATGKLGDRVSVSEMLGLIAAAVVEPEPSGPLTAALVGDQAYDPDEDE